MRLSITALAAGLLLAPYAAAFGRGTAMDIGPDDDTISAADLHKRAETTNGWGTFDQLIDHADPALGTFKQRYWYGTEFWKGPGSPIYLVTPGEQTGTGFNRTWLGSARLSGLMANQTGGAVVILEHRYWGGSSPYANLTVENLQYLTLDNSLKDLTYFAKNFVPPFDDSGASSAGKAPWVFAGGSYAGALAGWLAALEPDLVLSFGSKKRKQELKKKFMLEDLEDGDFAAALEWGPWQWQSTQFYSVKNTGYTPYYRFCDYVENVWPNSTNKVPGARGVGLAKALDGYAKYVKEEVIPGYCESAGYAEWEGELNIECFKGLDPNNVAYKDLTPGNWVNRPMELDALQRACPLHFPEGGYGLESGKRAKDVNRWTGGWDVTNTTRAMHTNGQHDPWRDATLSSAFRPGGPVHSSKQLPVRLVKGGVHCSDMYGPNWDANEDVKRLALDAAAEMKGWVGEWYEEKGVKKPWAKN
ncbi:hypothetical protein CHGG_08490 [Chaetomium globosum CBS 148.51]|uniref:Uncharacterized protein n=1 Tax=Chaetomium globosum (strain ATCC 6205 / CBS 148.51 / DSM 1962 / NBRC 6347 / NRRL 1970) TaxID=306901 RepID=Q2GU64_CHAGB|nr:uncharacterized protein CHGG_08490 [Chaetomium globosum CBS 148.51]EAQ84476.1 hypothetical protein CHGG_08490 [Chaetomium globosum CBS 148.51]